MDTIHQIFAGLDLAVTDHVGVAPKPAVNDYSIQDVVTTLLARVRGASAVAGATSPLGCKYFVPRTHEATSGVHS